MNFLIWNSRGTGARNFPGLVREIASFYSIDFMAILETRCCGSKAVNICNKLGFVNYDIVDAMGFKGGIWCCWNNKFRDIEIVCKNSQFIHVRLQRDTGEYWELTIVYGSPNPSNRRILWHELEQMSSNIVGPWCLAGDFNATLLASERVSSSNGGFADRDFNLFVQNLQLNDMGFVGPKFTWKRNNVESRIDRVIVNNSWLDFFPEATVTHLPFFKSDHRPLLLRTEILNKREHVEKPFRFIASWALHDQFGDFVKEKWLLNDSWNDNLASFTQACKVWNKEVFGHLTTRKKSLLRRLEGIHRVETRGYLPSDLLELQRNLWRELDDVLLQESLLWAQKARSDWYIYGDRNTKFFHSRANGRRKRNYVGAIKDANGEWVYEAGVIKALAMNYFSSLFAEERVVRDPIECIYSFPLISQDCLSHVGREVNYDEIKQVIFSMGAMKAPGPDGFNALFYQSQ